MLLGRLAGTESGHKWVERLAVGKNVDCDDPVERQVSVRSLSTGASEKHVDQNRWKERRSFALAVNLRTQIKNLPWVQFVAFYSHYKSRQIIA